jgi:putative hydrolase of the HAD superfamily
MRPEAVIFDWGGTLSDYAAVELADMWHLAAQHLAPHMPEDEAALMQRFGRIETEFWARTTTHQRAGTLADLLAAATEELGVDVAEAVLEEAAVRYLDAWTPHIVHDPEAAPTLAALRERGLKIGLLSNTHWPRAFHERFLARDGLAELIDARLYTSEMPYMKPHPEAFQQALAALGLEDGARAVFVGDRPLDDIHGAQQLGMRAVLRPNALIETYEVQPDATITRLPELLPLLDGWLNEGA